MAGGTFDKITGKVRPGTYINFLSGRREMEKAPERGIVAIPLTKLNWGPVGVFLKLTSDAPDAQMGKLGYSIYDNDASRQMLLIREAFKKAREVYVYRVNKGTAAKITDGSLTVTAVYGGTRGNAINVSVVANPVKGFDVKVNLSGTKVLEYNALTTIAELIDASSGNDYVVFSGDGSLSAVAGIMLAGGTDTTAQNADITKFLDALENIKFNTLAFPITEASLQTAAQAKIKYIRDSIGRGVQVVMPDTAAGDYEGVINVTNSVSVDGIALTHAEACAWVAAATAAAQNTKSNTYEPYVGADTVVDAKTHDAAILAIKNGETFFSVSEAGQVVLEYDINSLVTFTDGKDKTYRKNRVLRVFDTFSEALLEAFPPNKYENTPTGWDIMEGIGKTILKRFEADGAISNVDYDKDFAVDRGASADDETHFTVGLQPVDSAEKLYFNISTR